MGEFFSQFTTTKKNCRVQKIINMLKSIIGSLSGLLGTKESKAVCITYEDARARSKFTCCKNYIV